VRYILVALLILTPVAMSAKFVPSHHGDPSNPFLPLFMHLMPAPLVTNAHAVEHEHAHPHYMLTVDVPGPAAFDFDHDPSNGTQFVLTNLQLFQIAAVLLVLVCFSGVPSYLRTGKGDKISKLFAGFAMWLRDDVVYPAMGKEVGRKFLPYFLALFFFILFMNVLGLVPGAATATASVFVTAALALCTLVMMLIGGMIAQGPFTYWKTLVPHVPLAIWPIMFVVELVGIFVKPFALMIRLFANMTGGTHGRAVVHGSVVPDELPGRTRGELGDVAGARRLRRVHHDHRGLRGAVAGLRVHDAVGAVHPGFHPPRALRSASRRPRLGTQLQT
jgi:ATP synthase subunit 6